MTTRNIFSNHTTHAIQNTHQRYVHECACTFVNIYKNNFMYIGMCISLS